MDGSTNGFEDEYGYMNESSLINMRYEKSTNHVEINDDTRAALTCTNTGTRVLPGVGDILHEVKNLKQQLANVKEERDEFKEEVTFLKYQLAYRAQVQNLQKEMSGKTESEKPAAKKPKSVRFSANIAVNHRDHSEGEDETDESFDESRHDICDSSFDIEEYSRLRTENEELQDVLYDFYHDSKMAGKNANILVGDIESHPSESISSLVCRVLVNYDKLCEEHRILEEEKSKLDEDKTQLCNSMAKLREQFHDAVDSNIEEIEDLNRENQDLHTQVETFGGKNSEVVSALIEAREQYLGRLKAITDLSKCSTSDKLLQRLKNDTLVADSELKEAKKLVPKVEEDKANKLKRVQSLPSTLRQDSSETTERGGLLRELKTCKNLQESQRQQIEKILDEKLALETQVAELKRHVVLLKAERRVNVKTKSRLVQTEGEKQTGITVNNEKNSAPSGFEVDRLSRRCKDLEDKLEQAKRERQVAEEEKTSLLSSLYANIEKKDALDEQLAALQEKVSESGQKESRGSETKDVSTQTDGSPGENVDKLLSETDGGFQASYKGISEAKVELEKIRVQEQDKQIAMLKRENEAVKEKLKKSEDMSQTLQNCLKELTDEKHELLDSVEELNEEKAELEEARSKLEKELGGTRREKFVADEVSDIRNKERKVGDSLEASKAKLAQLDLKVVEVLALIGNEETGTKERGSDPDKGVEDMIGSLLSTVENLKLTVTTFKTTYENTKGDSLRTKNELEALSREKTELEALAEKLTKQNSEMAESLENSKKSQTSHENYVERLKSNNARLERELGQVHGSKTGYEKSLAESRRREEDLRRQLKNISTKRDDLQKAFDQLAKKSTETSSLFAGATKETEAVRSKNETLAVELEHLREELEGTVDDRDELLELLDRIVCENGTGEEKQGLGQKVERIRERSKSEENLTGIGLNDSGRTKPVREKFVASREMNMVYAADGENELFEEKDKIERNGKGIGELEEENQRLKEMLEKMLNDQKKMEVVLNSLSEANAEIQQGLEESLEHTEQIRLQGSENVGGEDSVDFAPEYPATTSDENAELRRLHEAMVGTNEALSTNLRRLHDEKTRSEQLKTSFHDVTRKNATLEKSVESLGKNVEDLEKNVENLTKDKEKTQKEILDLKKKQKDLERETQRAKNEKLDLESLLEENNGRVRDLKFQIDSLTEINQDLRETNEKLSGSSKEIEKKWTKLNDKFDELEYENEDLKKAKKRFEKELAEQGKKRTGLESALDRSEATIASLESEISSYTTKGRELEKSLETSERELAILRETAGKVTKLQQDAQDADTLKSEMEDRVTKLQQDAQDANTLRAEMDETKKSLSERDQRVVDLEHDVTRLKKEIQNSQRFVKAVSQENDTLRDSLSEWEREASKIRRHVHQLSQDAESLNQNGEGKKDSKSQELDKVRSVKAFEAMQVEMDAVNQHLKSLTAENQELATKIDALAKENTEMNDRNIQLLTRYDMVSKDLEKKTGEIAKLSKDAKNSDSRSKKNNELREKHEKEKTSLQTRIDKLDLENTLLKNSLANTLDEEKRLAESLENLIHSQKGKKIQNGGKSISRDRSKRPKDIVSEECWEIRTEISELSTTKPDLIRDSTEVKEERKCRSDVSAVESSRTGADTHELLADLLKGQMNLKNYCHEVVKLKDKDSHHGSEAKERIESSLDTTKAALEKAEQLNKDMESDLQKKEEELTKITEEKSKIETDAASIKEKCDKLQAVFRALVVLMKDKKGGEKKDGEEAEGPTRIIDYIKGIKTKYTTLVAEKENLEKKVGELEKEIEEHKARAKQDEKRLADGRKKHAGSEDKGVSEDKGRILNELLLSSARDKRRLLEKLQEIFDEFSKVKSKLDEELDGQSPSSNFEKISQEFAESIRHTERFIQSVAHDRPVTVVADSASEKDPNLELAKENEELIGRISAIQTSRRRESKNFKDELTRMEKNKKDAVKAEETKWAEEMEKANVENEKKMKEKEQAASELKNSLKQEVSQLKLDMRRLSDEHEVAQRTARNEARLASEKLEAEIKRLKGDMDRKVAENDSKMAEVKRKAEAEVKENARMAQVEISQVRASWADAERKVRAASEEKLDAVRELERVKGERSEEAARSARELQKLKVALESAQKQASEREDVFKRERDRMQRSISNLEGAVRNSEASGLERTQTRISEFQRSLDELSKQNQQLETARRNSEQSLGAEIERLRYENSKLQREFREYNQQRRIIGGNEQQRRPDPNVPSGERVKVMGTVRQPPVEKPRMAIPVESAPGPIPMRQPPVEKPRLITPVESAPGPFPVRQPPVEKPRLVTPVESAPGPIPGDPHRRVIKVREGQATSVHVSRVQDKGVRPSSDPRDTVSDELGAMFRQLNDSPEWMDDSRNTSTVIQARPMQARTQVTSRDVQSKIPQPEWETRQDRTWPIHKDPPRYPPNNTRPPASHTRPQPSNSSQRAGYYKEDSRQRPTYPNSKPITRQVQGGLESSDITSLGETRRVVEVKKLPVKDKSHSSKSYPRRPSVGSDDVFVTSSADVTLTSHGSKTGDFLRSRSLDDLTDTSEDRAMKHSGHRGARGRHEKLPKNYSGPRKGEPSQRGAASQVRGTGQKSGSKRVTALKGMEHILFQSQI